MWQVRIRQAVDNNLDAWLGFDDASGLISTLIVVLRDCPEVLQQQRVANDPEAFYWRLTVEAYELPHHLTFIICDGWQEGRRSRRR